MFIVSYLGKLVWGQAATQHDVIVEILGPFGKFQLWLTVLTFLSKFPIGWNQLAIIFIAPPAKFTCASAGTSGDPCPCAVPEYDKSVFTNTIIMEWKLICERESMVSVIQSVFQLGTLTGSLAFGMAADRFGRRIPLLVAVVIQFAVGMAMVYIYNYYIFAFCRFLIGFTVGGTMVVLFVIVMEYVGPNYRAGLSAVLLIPFNIAVLSLPLLAYYNRNWRDLQLVISVPVIVLFIYFFTIPETARWLLVKGRNEEAIKILQKAAKMNGRPTHTIRASIETHQLLSSRNKVQKANTIDLFKTPNLRRNICAMGWNWITCSFCYYGVSQYVSELGGNIFVNVAASATLVTAGTVLSIPLMNNMKRKTLLRFCFAGCSISLMGLALADGLLDWLAVACASVGVVTAFIVFVVVFCYTSELFPTVVRNGAVGFASSCARFGSMIAPFVIDLRIFGKVYPPLVFSIPPMIAFFLTALLPETKGCDLMTTMEEAENFKGPVKTSG